MIYRDTAYLKIYWTHRVKSQNFLKLGLELNLSFWGSFEKLRLGFELLLLMFYYVEPSSVFKT